MDMGKKKRTKRMLAIRGRRHAQLPLGGKGTHQLAAAPCYRVLVQRIEGLTPLLADMDQARFSQDRQMMGDGRLPHADPSHDLAHAAPLAAAGLHDLLTRRVGQCFGKRQRLRGSFIDTHRYIVYPRSLVRVKPGPRRVALDSALRVD